MTYSPWASMAPEVIEPLREEARGGDARRGTFLSRLVFYLVACVATIVDPFLHGEAAAPDEWRTQMPACGSESSAESE